MFSAGANLCWWTNDAVRRNQIIFCHNGIILITVQIQMRVEFSFVCRSVEQRAGVVS